MALPMLMALTLPAYAGSFRIRASRMSISREGKTVRLEFSRGVRATSSEGYTVKAVGARVILGSSGFSPLSDATEKADETVDELPALPSMELTSRSISLIRFFGRPVLCSPEYEVSAGSFSSTDGGEKWTLSGEVRFRRVGEREREITGEQFVFDRAGNLLTTHRAITISGFSTDKERVVFSAERTVIDLTKQQATLTGCASFRFGAYRLDAEEMQIDLAAAKLTAPKGGFFRQGTSELRAKYVVLWFEDSEVTLDASELTGKVRLEGVK